MDVVEVGNWNILELEEVDVREVWTSLDKVEVIEG